MKRVKALLFVLLLLTGSVYGQSVLLNDYSTNGFDLCTDPDTLRLEIINLGTDTLDTTRLSIDLPVGMQYVTGSVNSPVTEIDTTIAHQPVFSLPDIPNGDTFLVNLLVQAGCNTDVNDLDILYTLDFETGGLPGNISHLQVLNSFGQPSLAILSTSHTATPFMNVGDVFTQRITLFNGSFVPVKCVEILDVTSPGLQVTATNFGTLTVNGDTTILNSDTSVAALDSIVIVLDLMVVSCNDHNSEVIINWGCKGDLCHQLNRNEGTLTQIDPFVISIGRLRTRTSELTPCQADTIRIIYINESTEPNLPGSANIFNLNFRVGVGQVTYRNYDWLNMHSWMIGNTAVNPSSICDSLNPCIWNFEVDMLADPDGPGGLSDLDGDGFFDDLAVGDSIVMTFCVNQTCLADSCPGGNNNTTFFSRIFGTSQCGQNVASYYYWPMYRYYNYYYAYGNTVSSVDLAAGPNGDTLSHSLFFNYARGENTCLANPQTTFFLVLPAGVSIIGDPIFNNVAVAPADWYISNDTLYYSSYMTIVYGRFMKLDLNLVADCSTAAGFAQLQLGVITTCDTTCPCPDVLFCRSGTPFYVHGCTANNCTGAQALSLDLHRHNLGWGDINRTVVADPVANPAIRLDQLITYDTLAYSMPGIVGRTVFDSLHAILRYHSGDLPGTRLIDFLEGNFQIFDSNGVQKANCVIPLPETYILVDTVYFDFNLTKAVATCPFTFASKDSIDLRGFFRVRDDFTPPGNGAIIMEFGQGYFETDSVSNSIICDRWHLSPLIFYVPDPTVQIHTGLPCTGWGGSHQSWTRCEPMWLKVGLNMYHKNMNCWSCDFFPGEWRDIANLDTIRVVLPEGLSYVPGTSNYSNWYFSEGNPLPDPFMLGDTMIYVNPGTWSPSGSSGCDYRRNLQTIYFQILPTCTYDLSSSDQVMAIVDWDNYLYAPDKLVHLERNLKPSNLQVSFPNYTLSALTNTAIGTTDTSEWVLDVHNTSLNYTSDYNYLYFSVSVRPTPSLLPWCLLVALLYEKRNNEFIDSESK